MSANSTAASTPWRRTGWSVTSAQSSGVSGDLEEGVPLADRPVLGQRAAGLAHEPDRRALDRLTPQRADEERLGHRRRLAADAGGSRPRRPAGPLGVRWLAYELEPVAGGRGSAARGRAGERRRGALARPLAAYHWLDDLGNAIDWDGLRTPLRRSRPGERAELELPVRAPIPPEPVPARLRPRARAPLLALGDRQLDARRSTSRSARATRAAAVAHLPPGVEPAPDWHELVARRARGGLRRGRRRDRAPAATASCARTGPAAAATRPSPSRSSARRSSCRWRRTAPSPACPRGGRRATSLDLRRRRELARGLVSPTRRKDASGLSSTAIRSSTRPKTHAPSASATTAAAHR